MSKLRIEYAIEERDAVLADVVANGWNIESDTTIGLVDGRISDCHLVVETQGEDTAE